MVDEVVLELPYPPTVNHYWKHTRSGIHYVPKKGKAFQQAVVLVVKNAKCKRFTGKVAVEVDIYPPDKRERDIDNIFKALFDSLTKSGVIVDDRWIYKLTAEKHDPIKGGKVLVSIKEWQCK